MPAPALRQMFEEMEFILSEDVCALEKRLAGFVGAPFCVAASDAASAVALALASAGIGGSGDSVLCTALGCGIPVQGILMAGAAPVFVDVSPNSYTIDPYCLEYALNKLNRAGETMPKALIATDLFGAPCQYEALEHICGQRGIVLIEDMSGAFGAKFAGKTAGSFGRFAVASFSASGPLEELGGAAVFCHDEDDARRLASLRQANKQQFFGEVGAVLPCVSSADALVMDARLEYYIQQLERRRYAAKAYRESLQGVVHMQQPVCGSESAYSQFVVALPRNIKRSRVAGQMRAMNIPCGPPLCGMQTAYSDWNRVMLTNTLALSERLLSLPIHPYLSGHLVEYICRCLVRCIDTP